MERACDFSRRVHIENNLSSTFEFCLSKFCSDYGFVHFALTALCLVLLQMQACIVVVSLFVSHALSLSVTPSTVNLGLSWGSDGSGNDFVPVSLVASGNNNQPVSWSLIDANAGNRDVTAVKTASGHIYGSFTLSGALNTTCMFTPPVDYPPSRTVNIRASISGASTATSDAVVTFTFAFNLEEYWMRRARMNIMPVTKPANLLSPSPFASLQVLTQPETLIFAPLASTWNSTSLFGQWGSGPSANPAAVLEVQIIDMDPASSGPGFPVTAGIEFRCVLAVSSFLGCLLFPCGFV